MLWQGVDVRRLDIDSRVPDLARRKQVPLHGTGHHRSDAGSDLENPKRTIRGLCASGHLLAEQPDEPPVYRPVVDGSLGPQVSLKISHA